MRNNLRPFITSFVALCALIVSAADYPIRHSRIGQCTVSADSSVVVTLVHKMQQYNWNDRETLDKDIHSPKSVNIHPDGTKFYVNSLEGCATVVYEMDTWRKLKVIHHRFDASTDSLWAPASGLFPFRHYTKNLNTFQGKPVESAFSHGGRYLWVPYYRRTYDINAQDPSAVAIIDTRSDSIVRMMETGPLPKMVAMSHDGRYMAITHWGDNTVALVNIQGDDPRQWHYEQLFIVDYQLKLNLSLTQSVNRDVNSGYTLRGTVFTPDDHYLLVGCMGGGGGIAVIDMQQMEYKGRVLGMRSNVRHLIIKDNYLYLSINGGGYVQRVGLDDFLSTAAGLSADHKTVRHDHWEDCKVLGGARTIEASPSGHFIFAACNAGSRLCVVDTRKMKIIAEVDADSYPVGLDISRDGSVVITTSQGRSNGGGNAVNVFRVTYAEPEPDPVEPSAVESSDSVVPADSLKLLSTTASAGVGTDFPLWLLALVGGLVLVVVALFAVRKTKH